MAGSHYQPETLRIRVGDTVRFTNDDTVDHTVFAPTIGFAFDLGRQKPGEARSYRFGRAGRIEVECVNHGHMLMTVEVTP
jgi:plastocyanin